MDSSSVKSGKPSGCSLSSLTHCGAPIYQSLHKRKGLSRNDISTQFKKK